METRRGGSGAVNAGQPRWFRSADGDGHRSALEIQSLPIELLPIMCVHINSFSQWTAWNWSIPVIAARVNLKSKLTG